MYNSLMNNTSGDAAATVATKGASIWAVLHAAHTLEDRVEEALGRAGLSTPKYSVLNALVETGEALSLSDLAARLSCVRSNMTQLVDRLEADGLVRRVSDPHDRRAVRAAITDEGRAKYEAGALELETLHEMFSASVSASDRDALVRLLSAVK
jgi:DNA-binding MarR family transcriptional regulator